MAALGTDTTGTEPLPFKDPAQSTHRAMLVDLVRGRRVAPAIGRYQEDLWMSSYETPVFVTAESIGFSTTPAVRTISEVA